MAQLLSLPRSRAVDHLAAPIGAFESETQAVIQQTTPSRANAIAHVIVGMVATLLVLMCVLHLDKVVTGRGSILPTLGSFYVQPLQTVLVKSIRSPVSGSGPGLRGSMKVLRPSAFASLRVRRVPAASHQLIRPTP